MATSEHCIQKAREWREQNRERHRELSRNKYYRQKAAGTIVPPNPEKKRARSKVQTCLRNGTLTKPSDCPSCNKPTPSHRMHAHHHNGYDKPMDVVWACSLCHGKQHRIICPELDVPPAQIGVSA